MATITTNGKEGVMKKILVVLLMVLFLVPVANAIPVVKPFATIDGKRFTCSDPELAGHDLGWFAFGRFFQDKVSEIESTYTRPQALTLEEFKDMLRPYFADMLELEKKYNREYVKQCFDKTLEELGDDPNTWDEGFWKIFDKQVIDLHKSYVIKHAQMKGSQTF